MSEHLTGRRRYRVAEQGAIVLQVETETRIDKAPPRPGGQRWRDATVEDLTVHDQSAGPSLVKQIAGMAVADLRDWERRGLA